MNVAVVITGREPEAIETVFAQTSPAREIVVAHTANQGIARTTAPLVALVDRGDRLEPAWLSTASELLAQRGDLSFACCAVGGEDPESEPFRPPPSTVAEVLGRGACGYVAPVFRRELWERLGGFDEALGKCAGADFWLRASTLGFSGAIVRETLVRQGAAAGLAPDLWDRARLLDKHRELATRYGEDVFVSMLDRGQELRAQARQSVDERRALERALACAEDDVADVHAALTPRGIAPLECPEPLSGSDRADELLMASALQELVPANSRPRRTLMICAGDRWPQEARPVHDLLIVYGALECAADPRSALAACRRALRPGGRMIVLASAMPLDGASRRGYTEAALRTQLSQVFDPGDIMVVGFGSVATSVATVLGIPLERAELGAGGSAHPTVVAGSARAPGKRRTQLTLPTHKRLHHDTAGRAVILAYREITPDAFAGHMALVAQRYVPVTLRKLVDQVLAREVTQGAVAVTLDTEDSELTAIASEHGISLTHFVHGTCDGGVAYSGSAGLRATQEAEEAGFSIGCTSEPGAVTEDSDPLRLPRIVVCSEDIRALELRLERWVRGKRCRS